MRKLKNNDFGRFLLSQCVIWHSKEFDFRAFKSSSCAKWKLIHQAIVFQEKYGQFFFPGSEINFQYICVFYVTPCANHDFHWFWNQCVSGSIRDVSNGLKYFRSYSMVRKTTGIILLKNLMENFGTFRTTICENPWFLHFLLQNLRLNLRGKNHIHDERMPWRSLTRRGATTSYAGFRIFKKSQFATFVGSIA